MLVGYFQDGENLTVWLIESTDGGNPSIFVIAFSMQGSQRGLGNTKVSREARQVPVLYPIFKGSCFFNRRGVAWLNKTIYQFLPTCLGVMVQPGRALVISC